MWVLCTHNAAFHSWVVPGCFLVEKPGVNPKLQLSWELTPRVGLSLCLELLNPTQCWKNWPRTQQPSSKAPLSVCHRVFTGELKFRKVLPLVYYSFCSCYVLRWVDHKTSTQTKESPWSCCLLHGFLFTSPLLLYIRCLRRASADILDFERVWFSARKLTEDNLSETGQPTCLTNIICVLHYLWWLTGSSFPAFLWCSSPHTTTVGKDCNSKF